MVEFLKEPFALAIIAGLMSMLVLYINNKVNKEKNVRSDYIKTFALVSIICFIILQIFSHNGGGLTDMVGGGEHMPATLLNDKFIDMVSGGEINMRGGHPNF